MSAVDLLVCKFVNDNHSASFLDQLPNSADNEVCASSCRRTQLSRHWKTAALKKKKSKNVSFAEGVKVGADCFKSPGEFFLYDVWRSYLFLPINLGCVRYLGGSTRVTACGLSLVRIRTLYSVERL